MSKKRRVTIHALNPTQEVIKNFQAGTLTDSSGRVVVDQKTALALALKSSGISYRSLENAEMLNKIRVMKSMLEQTIEKQFEQNRNIEEKVINYFKSKRAVTPRDIGELENKMGLFPGQINEIIYRILSSFLVPGSSAPTDITVQVHQKEADPLFKELLNQAGKISKSLEDYVQKQEELRPIEHDRPAPTTSMFDTLRYPSHLLSFPFFVSADVPNNEWMQQKAMNYDKAYAEYIEFYRLVAMSSLVYLLPSEKNLQDQVYTANLGIIIPAHIKQSTCVLSNFRSAPREGEEEPGRNFFSAMGFNVEQSPYFFEGFADLKFIKENIFIGGHGIRTDINTYNWMEQQFGIQIVKIHMTDDLLYHFDCQFFQVDAENAFVAVESIDPGEVKLIEKVINIIPVSVQDARNGTCNSLRIGNVILNASSIQTLQKEDEQYAQEAMRTNFVSTQLAKLGVEPIYVNLGEFEKSGAALSCFALPLNYIEKQK